jgi:hypothetical protein
MTTTSARCADPGSPPNSLPNADPLGTTQNLLEASKRVEVRSEQEQPGSEQSIPLLQLGPEERPENKMTFLFEMQS